MRDKTEVSSKYVVRGLDDCGYYCRRVDSEDEVKKIVKTGTVQNVTKIVTTETRWNVPGCGDYDFPADWSDDSDCVGDIE